MARMASRRRPAREGVTGVTLAEGIVIVLILAMIVAGGRYYFMVYRKSPGFVLGEFLGQVKKGDYETQYALLDDDDKRDYPTAKDYAKCQLARGYVARIVNVSLAPEVLDKKNPNVATIDATVGLRSLSGELYQTSSDAYSDHYTLRKNGSGEWRVWLRRSTINMLKATPTPNGDPI